MKIIIQSAIITLNKRINANLTVFFNRPFVKFRTYSILDKESLFSKVVPAKSYLNADTSKKTILKENEYKSGIYM